MARTGSFGRLPRSVPSLTNTLIAIAREQQQAEDNDLMTAWQKGGSVNGKKVTDGMVLAHWHDRLKDISTDDPLYDTYKNAIQQYEYSIAESKTTAAYAQITNPTSGDDSKVAQFYMNWSKKIPKDSEFYRILLRDAGQFLRSAKAKADAKTRGNTEKAYNARMDALEKHNELPGQTALRFVTMLGQEGSQGSGSVLGETPLGNASNIANTTNITDVQLPGVDQMIALLGTVAPEKAGPGKNGEAGLAGPANANVLFTDENGKPVTGKDIVASFKAMDPSFNGKFTLQYVQGLISKQRDGLQKRIDLAQKTGHVSDMMSLTMQQAKVNEYGREIAAWPVASEYSALHDQKQKLLNDVTSGRILPDAFSAAMDKINAKIGALANDPRIAADGHMQSQLTGEANSTPGTLTLAEDLAGTHTGYTEEQKGTSDIDKITELRDVFQAQKDAVDAGEMVYTQGDYVKGPDGKTTFIPSTQGKSIGAATMSAINNLPGVGKPVPVMVPNGDGGGSTPMYVVPAPIMATAKAPNGSSVDVKNANPVGGYIRYSVNGVETTLYSIDRNGKTEWSIDPPWDSSKVKTSEANGVITLDLYPGGLPDNVKAGMAHLDKNQDFLNGFAIEGATTNKDGTVSPGKLVFDPRNAALGTDGARQAAGHDPYTDSFSASLAAAKAVPDGPRLIQQWTGDPRFGAILEQNARMAAGMTLDPTTGQWTGGDQNAYTANMVAMNRDLAYAKTGAPNDSNPALRDAWWRDDTSTQMDGAPASAYGPPTPAGFATPLATNVIKQDTGAGMQQLSTAFTPGGTLVSQGKQKDDIYVPAITMKEQIKVPSLDPKTLPSITPTASPTPVTGPAPTTAPTTVPTTTSGYGNSSSGGYGNKHQS